MLRDPQESQLWLTDSMATIDTAVDCGSWGIEFFMDDGLETPIDPATFGDFRDVQNSFTTLYTEDIGKVGLYPMKYRVYPLAYPDNFIDSPDPFTIEIVDPCSPPTSLSLTGLLD